MLKTRPGSIITDNITDTPLTPLLLFLLHPLTNTPFDIHPPQRRRLLRRTSTYPKFLEEEEEGAVCGEV